MYSRLLNFIVNKNIKWLTAAILVLFGRILFWGSLE